MAERSTERFPADRGFVTGELPKGPNGRNCCRKCGKECEKKRQTFCSKECVHEWRLRTDGGYQTKHVLARDKGVCALCGLDCLALREELVRAMRELRAVEWCAERGIPRHLWSRRLWEMDHTIPVVEGGGACGLENLRTLCWACHREQTTQLAKRRAERRRGPLLPGLGGADGS